MIQNSEAVISYFGYWPQFCDGKIRRFTFEKAGSIGLTISYIDSDQDKRALVEIQFSGVFDVDLHDLHSENVLDNLNISADTSPVRIELEACCGLRGAFSCETVEVVNVAT